MGSYRSQHTGMALGVVVGIPVALLVVYPLGSLVAVVLMLVGAWAGMRWDTR